MAVESFGLPPLPSEVILPFAGVLIARGAPGFTWPAVLAAALLGSVVGSLFAYELGRRGGRALILRWGRKVGLDARMLERSERYFARHGAGTVGLARLVPLLRAYISYPAGAARMDRGSFALFTALGALPFCAVMVYLGTILGKNFTVLEAYFNYLDIVVVVALVLLVGWVFLRWRRKGLTPSTATLPPAPDGPP